MIGFWEVSTRRNTDKRKIMTLLLGHSTRAASCSKAKIYGAHLEVIAKNAG